MRYNLIFYIANRKNRNIIRVYRWIINNGGKENVMPVYSEEF